VWASELLRGVAGALAAGALALPLATSGQSRPLVTDADVARAAKSQPAITETDIANAARKHRMPSEAELARVPVPSMPKVDALPQPTVQRKVDLGAIAQGFDAVGQASPASLGNEPTLLVFVSFSMPEASLARLVDQASRAGAVVLIRGFVEGSLQRTVARAQRLIGQRQVGFQIDPQAFDRFGISVAPTFVLLKSGSTATPCAAGACFAASSFALVAGDVSLDYALEFFRRSAPAFRREASGLLTKLKGGT